MGQRSSCTSGQTGWQTVVICCVISWDYLLVEAWHRVETFPMSPGPHKRLRSITTTLDIHKIISSLIRVHLVVVERPECPYGHH